MNELSDIGWKQLRAVAVEIESAKARLEVLQTPVSEGSVKEQLGDAIDKLSCVLELLRSIGSEGMTSMLENELHCKLCGSQLIYRIDAFPPGRFMASSDYVGGVICLLCMTEHCAQTNCLQCELGNWPGCEYAWIKRSALRDDVK